jgi:hypothetical protein
MAAKPPSVDKYFLKVWENNQGFLIVIMLIIVLVIAIKTGDGIAKRIENTFRKIFGNPNAPKEVPEPNAANIPNGWSPEPLALELFSVLDGLFTASWTKCNTADKLHALNDDQFISVVLKFQEKYATEDYPTLRSWMMDEANVCFAGFVNVYTKMDRLGL